MGGALPAAGREPVESLSHVLKSHAALECCNFYNVTSLLEIQIKGHATQRIC